MLTVLQRGLGTLSSKEQGGYHYVQSNLQSMNGNEENKNKKETVQVNKLTEIISPVHLLHPQHSSTKQLSVSHTLDSGHEEHLQSVHQKFKMKSFSVSAAVSKQFSNIHPVCM